MEIKRTTELISQLFGAPEAYTFENRTFNAVMLLVSVTGAATLLYDFILSNYIVQLIDLFCFLYPLGCYLYSKKTKEYEFLIKWSFALFYIALSIAWFLNNGIHGSLPSFFFLLVIYCVVLLKKPFKFFVPFVIATVILLTVFEFIRPEYFVHYDNKIQDFTDIGISLVLCLVINGLLVHLIFNEYIKERKSNKELLNQALMDKEVIEKSIKEIQTLKGILPICYNCKKIKDSSSGTWKVIEEYIREHSEAQFSHGICPDCFQRLHPDLADKILERLSMQ